MLIQRDEVLYRIYDRLVNELSICSRSDAELLFWVQTCRLVLQSRMDAKNDVLGILMNLVMGDKSSCNEVYYFCRDKQSDYQKFEQEFRITDCLEDLGRCWKKSLSAAERPSDLLLRDWIEGYLKMMPAVDRIIAEKELEFGSCGGVRLTEQDVALRRREYRKSRAQMTRLMKKLNAVGEFLSLCE